MQIKPPSKSTSTFAYPHEMRINEILTHLSQSGLHPLAKALSVNKTPLASLISQKCSFTQPLLLPIYSFYLIVSHVLVIQL